MLSAILLSLHLQAKFELNEFNNSSVLNVDGEYLLKIKDPDKSIKALQSTAYKLKSKFKIFKKLKLLYLEDRDNTKLFLKKIKRDPNIEYIEANHHYFSDLLYRIDAYPGDDLFERQWSLNNPSNDADIDAPEAWSITVGSSDIRIAVIDSGVDYTHRDLYKNIWQNNGELGIDENGKDKSSNGIDDDENGFVDDLRGWDFVNDDNDPNDDRSHGTHVAGVIGAMANNNVGIVGINWQIQMMPIKVINSSGSASTENIIKAIEYAVLNGARILNCSFGGGNYSQAYKEAIEYAKDNNVLFVSSAGNSKENNDLKPHYPSSYEVENVIAVAASAKNDRLAYFSSYGLSSVDLAAPGDLIISTIPGNKYERQIGTSTAVPHVVGAAALLLSVEPYLTVEQLKWRILNSVDTKDTLEMKVLSGGRLNLFNMFERY